MPQCDPLVQSECDDFFFAATACARIPRIDTGIVIVRYGDAVFLHTTCVFYFTYVFSRSLLFFCFASVMAYYDCIRFWLLLKASIEK